MWVTDCNEDCYTASSRGFSLLELLVAISVTAILGGIGVLSHHAMRARINLMTAVRQVVLDLKVRRMRAVASNTGYRIVFGKETYKVQRQQGTRYRDEGDDVPLPPGIEITDCTAADDAISFRPRGNAGTFGSITLTNSAGDVRRVIVDITGQVRVE